MAPLHTPVASVAVAHCDIEPAHDGSPDDLFLILCFAAFRFHAAAAMRAVLRQWHGNLFIYAPRNGAACLASVAAPRFAAWTLRLGFGGAARMWRGLTLAGTQCGFQFPAQALCFLSQTLVFFL
jgi:hypothetical protein